MKIRKLLKSDYKTLEKWWKAWDWPPIKKDFLPEDGESGLMVEAEDGTLIVAGFLYMTNSNAVLLEWIISNPEYRENDRDSLIELLIEGAENMVKHLEYKYLFSVCQHEKLIDKHKKLGWVIDKSPSHEMTKILK